MQLFQSMIEQSTEEMKLPSKYAFETVTTINIHIQSQTLLSRFKTNAKSVESHSKPLKS